MAVKPRSNNRINQSRDADAHGPTKDSGVVREKERQKDRSQDPLFEEGYGHVPDTEEMEAIVFRMREKETKVYHTNCKERLDIANNDLVALWRQMLVNWMFYVVDCCDLQRHSVAAAVYFLDVAILRELCTTREEHQLAAATALQMALKTVDTAVIKLDKLVKLGRGLFTEEDVATMEMKIIMSLNWNLHPPTVYCYLRQFERLTPSEIGDPTREIIDQATNVIAEEMVLDERYIRYCPSVQGLATILVALDFVPDGCLPEEHRETYVSRLSTASRLDGDSPVLSRVIKKIYKSLKRTGKFQTLIEISMTKTKSLDLASQRVLENVEQNNKAASNTSNNNNNNKASKNTDNEEQQRSPRDVTEKFSNFRI